MLLSLTGKRKLQKRYTSFLDTNCSHPGAEPRPFADMRLTPD
jgi:hypothetical protein